MAGPVQAGGGGATEHTIPPVAFRVAYPYKLASRTHTIPSEVPCEETDGVVPGKWKTWVDCETGVVLNNPVDGSNANCRMGSSCPPMYRLFCHNAGVPHAPYGGP